MKSLMSALKLGFSNTGISNLSTKNLDIKAFSKCLGISLYLFFINKDIILHIDLIESGIIELLSNKS